MNLNAEKIMTSNLVTISYSEDLMVAFHRMQQESIRHLPVIDDNRNIVGIISERDIQKAMGPTGRERGARAAQVADYMNWPIVTMPLESDLIDVVQKMTDNKISAILITQGQHLKGIVTTEDLLIVLSALLKNQTSMKDRLIAWTYNSPIGQLLKMISDAGI